MLPTTCSKTRYDFIPRFTFYFVKIHGLHYPQCNTNARALPSWVRSIRVFSEVYANNGERQISLG